MIWHIAPPLVAACLQYYHFIFT